MTTTPSSVKVKSESGQTLSKTRSPIAWRSLLGLGMIFLELWLNTGIIWGVFMLLWAIMGIQTGQTYILEILERQKHPILFWVTIFLWLLIAGFFFMSNAHIYGFFQGLISNL